MIISAHHHRSPMIPSTLCSLYPGGGGWRWCRHAGGGAVGDTDQLGADQWHHPLPRGHGGQGGTEELYIDTRYEIQDKFNFSTSCSGNMPSNIFKI